MSDHRRTVTRKALVLPGWVLLLVAALVLAGTSWLGWLVVAGDDDGTTAAPAPSASATPTPSPTPEPTETTASPEPEETKEPEPEPTEEPEPEADRSSIAVSVLNASRTTGLARTVGQRVQQAGWTVGAVGNWRGYVAGNTVFHPAGRDAEAQLLADDLGIATVSPSEPGMSGERLTVIVVGPVG